MSGATSAAPDYWQLRFYRRKCLTLSIFCALQWSIVIIPWLLPFPLKPFSQICAWMPLVSFSFVATALFYGSRWMLAATQCNATNWTGFYSPVRSAAVAWRDQWESKLCACGAESPSSRNIGSRSRGGQCEHEHGTFIGTTFYELLKNKN